MSTYPTTPTRGGQAVAEPSKPGTLVAAWAAAILAGLSAVVCGIVILAGGLELAKEVVAKALADLTGESIDQILADGELDIAASAIQEQLSARAYFVLGCGALLLLFALFMGKAATWARVLVTIFAPITILAAGALIAIRPEESTTLMLVTSWVAVLGALVAIVLTWLPPNGRYAKARKLQG